MAMLTESIAITSVLAPQIVKPDASGEAIDAALVGITKHGDAPLEGFQTVRRSASNERAAPNRSSADRAPPSKKYRGVFERGARAPTYWVMWALIAGFQMMRQMVGHAALAKRSRRPCQSARPLV